MPSFAYDTLSLHSPTNLTTSAMGERRSSPNCTHVDMDRVYGYDQRCSVCGCIASIGFLYQCKQDSRTVVSQNSRNTGSAKSRLRNELETSGLSESVILSAEDGHYTEQQLQRLKQLKSELRHTITDEEQADQANDVISRLMDVSKARSSTEGVLGSPPAVNTGLSECTFKACHACRPHCLDRVYISFQAAVSTVHLPMTQADVAKLPVRSAAIMRNMNTKGRPLSTKKTVSPPATSPSLPRSASPNKPDPGERRIKITQADIEQSILQRRPYTDYYKPGHHPCSITAQDPYRQTSLLRTQGFKTAVQGIFRYHHEPGTSIPSLSPSHSGTTSEFDTSDVRRARRERMRRQLKDNTSANIPENTTKTGNVRSVRSDSKLQVYSLEPTHDTRTSEAETKHTMIPRPQTASKMHSPKVVSFKRPDTAVRLRKPQSVASRAHVGLRTKDGSTARVGGLQRVVAHV